MFKISKYRIGCYINISRSYILGIETSCDDTGTAIIDCKGNLLSEYVNSQINVTSNIGGIIPTVARQLHLYNIDPAVKKVMIDANLSFQDLTAIAVTVKPGLPLSLAIGRDYSVMKAKEYKLPIIPIHHMEAHALTVRMLEKDIDFPFMVLLISGGNSLLGLAHDVDSFSMLGTRLDISPGDCLDKIARMLNLIGVNGTHTDVSGGRALELMASKNVDSLIDFSIIRPNKRDCNFSFSGLEGSIYLYIQDQKRSGLTLNIPQVCASALYMMAFQICKNISRAMFYCQRYLEECPKTLVVSGGVASNLFLRTCFQRVCDQFNYRLLCPPVKYCCDNGAMIAWNGYELYKVNKRIVYDVDSVDYSGRSPFGLDLRKEIQARNIKASKFEIKDIFIK